MTGTGSTPGSDELSAFNTDVPISWRVYQYGTLSRASHTQWTLAGGSQITHLLTCAIYTPSPTPIPDLSFSGHIDSNIAAPFSVLGGPASKIPFSSREATEVDRKHSCENLKWERPFSRPGSVSTRSCGLDEGISFA